MAIALKSRFRGCLLGALAGDCYGSPCEYKTKPVPYSEIQPYFDEDSKQDFPLRITDDTAMLRSIAFSLVENQKLVPSDVAHRFTLDFYNDPHNVRGEYGTHVRHVFRRWNQLGLQTSSLCQNEEDLWKPASEQFNGAGSAGNGGSMRIAPVPLLYHKDTKLMIQVVTDVTRLTHTHQDGVRGALLIAFAIKRVLHTHKEQFDRIEFVNSLIEDIKSLETEEQSSSRDTEPDVYQKKLEIVKRLLEKDNVKAEEVIEKLGNNVLAEGSVVTAIYCFLRALKQYPDSPSGSELEKCLKLAMHLGGDADTIATMAGAVMGALIGDTAIPEHIPQRCLCYEDTSTLADRLYDLFRKEAPEEVVMISSV